MALAISVLPSYPIHLYPVGIVVIKVLAHYVVLLRKYLFIEVKRKRFSRWMMPTR